MNLVSNKTREIVKKNFPRTCENKISKLQDFCEYLSTLFSDKPQPETYERFCFAVLKIAQTSDVKFVTAIELGRVDYRDLLVSADFANSLNSHSEWVNNALN
ncbi:MAG: hypothetical protein COA63_000535 [Methylophaga sp.]|nr:hypothetical protein [Methylophaga sp.]